MNLFRSTTTIATDSVKRSPVGPALLLMSAVLTCLALLPSVRAVTPAPDGAYPNGNTAEGISALLSLTTGGFDTAIGAAALLSDTTGDSNTAVGANSLRLLTTGSGNTALGVQALFHNNGSKNVAVGCQALSNNAAGTQNTAVGYQALFSNVGSSDLLGNYNTAIGYQSLFSNTTGFYNTATGVDALLSNATGTLDTANGSQALFSNTSGSANTAVGTFALYSNTTGGLNTATGVQALVDNTTGNNNTATGASALSFITTGGNNTATGSGAYAAANGSGNTATGAEALSFAMGSFDTADGAFALERDEGSQNIALGFAAGISHISGSNNIYIANAGASDESNTTRIGGGVQTRTFIAGIRGRTTGNANAVPVVIDSVGQLGTVSSSRRFKNEIKPMDKTSEAILALKPVTFHYNSDHTGTSQFGLIAEEVAAVNPDLVVRDENGEIYTVRYDAVNAMLLNEFLKEHRKVEQQDRRLEQQEATIAQQQKQIDALTAGLHRVSDQFELSKSAPKMAVNNHKP